MRWLAVLALVAVACATSSPKTSRSECEDTATAEYHRCLNPQYHGLTEEPPTVTNSTEQQACRQAFNQAMSQCQNLNTQTKTSTSPFLP